MGYKALIILNIVLLAVIARLVFKPLSPAPGIRVWEGETWTAAQYGSRYILSIKNHSELASAITSFVKARGITSGSIYGIGAVNSATLRFFDPSTKKYIDKTFDGQMEIANLTGNIGHERRRRFNPPACYTGNPRLSGAGGTSAGSQPQRSGRIRG